MWRKCLEEKLREENRSPSRSIERQKDLKIPEYSSAVEATPLQLPEAGGPVTPPGHG